MNYMPGDPSLPPGCTQADIDRYFGPDLSDAAQDALTAHAAVQADIQRLRDTIRNNSHHMLFERYEELEGALDDASLKDVEIEDLIYQEEADRAEAARQDAAEYRAEMRRDEEDWS
jgi:hypothetical protein